MQQKHVFQALASSWLGLCWNCFLGKGKFKKQKSDEIISSANIDNNPCVIKSLINVEDFNKGRIIGI